MIVVIRNPLQHRLSLAQSMAGSQKSEISSTKKNSYFFRLFTQREFTVLIYHFSDFAVYDNCIVLDLFCKLLASIYWICPMKMVIWLFFLSTETFAHTVKPFYSGHHSDLKIVSVVERCPLHKVFSQIY